MKIILKSKKVINNQILFDLPKIKFDEKPELEFRIINCFISFENRMVYKYDKTIFNGLQGKLFSLRCNWIDRSTGNPSQDICFMTEQISQSSIHYEPTHVIGHKLKLLNLEDSLFYLHAYDTEIPKINFIIIHIEICPYGGF